MLNRISGSSKTPVIDLATVRETLVYMRDDMKRHEALGKAAGALDTAIREIDRSLAIASYRPVNDESRKVLTADFMPRWR